MARKLTEKQKEILARRAKLGDNPSLRDELTKIADQGGEPTIFSGKKGVPLWRSDSGSIYNSRDEWISKRRKPNERSFAHMQTGVPMELVKNANRNLKNCVVCQRPSYSQDMIKQKKFGFVCNSCHRQKLIKRMDGGERNEWEWDTPGIAELLGGDPRDAERFLQQLFD